MKNVFGQGSKFAASTNAPGYFLYWGLNKGLN
jgi:hypothetical protein